MPHRVIFAAPFAAIFGLFWGASIAAGSWVSHLPLFAHMDANEFNSWLLGIASGISLLSAAAVTAWQRVNSAKREDFLKDDQLHRESLSGKLDDARREREHLVETLSKSEADRQAIRKELEYTRGQISDLYARLPAWLLARLDGEHTPPPQSPLSPTPATTVLPIVLTDPDPTPLLPRSRQTPPPSNPM